MRGFQLWINLPAAEKMKDAGYRDFRPEEIPEAMLPDGGRVRVLAGLIETEAGVVEGPVTGVTTEPVYIDVSLPAGSRFEHAVPKGHSAVVHVFEGQAAIGSDTLDTHVAGVLSDGDRVTVSAHEGPTRFLLIAGRPIKEPVVQYGPFVMNTREEIEQALADYQAGRLTA